MMPNRIYLSICISQDA
uniref:Uncharacterized protein n=1 Tax=Arundo donax TaxID=35708 RepID=A0A0A8YWQ7_ARUDO